MAANAKKVFEEADKDNNGFLTKSELRKYFKKNPEEKERILGSDFKWSEFFANMDANDDGKFDLKEFTNYLQARQVFQDADKNKNGFLTKSELRKYFKKHPEEKDRILGSAFKWGELFDLLDKNGDKQFDVNEFTHFVARAYALSDTKEEEAAAASAAAAAAVAEETGPNEERTYIMIKPDGVQRGLIGNIIGRFEAKGFKLVAMKVCSPSKAHLEKHYADLSSKKFFPSLIEYMLMGPVCAMVWEGKGAVATGRVMLGATNPADSKPGTIRGDLCIDVGRNICHGSDSVESANAEIGLWFPEGLNKYGHHSAKMIYE